MKTIKIMRQCKDWNQSLGICTVLNEVSKPIFGSFSLERGWRDNEPRVSCIPTGTYKVVLEFSDKFKKKLWEIKGVKDRSECKFHSANYWRQLNGCIALGKEITDLDGDGYNDVTSSKATMEEFHKVFGEDTEATLIITD